MQAAEIRHLAWQFLWDKCGSPTEFLLHVSGEIA